MAPVEQLGGNDSWQVVCLDCCCVALVFAIMHLYHVFFKSWVVLLFDSGHINTAGVHVGIFEIQQTELGSGTQVLGEMC